MQAKIMASLAAADPLTLSECIRQAERAGVDCFHLDLEDGQFVPNITFGLKVVRSVASYTELPVHIHLLVREPERIIEELQGLRLDSIFVHFEATDYPLRTLALIHRSGVKAGLAFNPRTSIADAAYAFGSCESLLLMTNEPDLQGERFLNSSYERVSLAQRLFRAEPEHVDHEIIVDGAIDTDTIQLVISAGATAVVCGRAVFGTPDIAANVKALRAAVLARETKN